MAVLDDVKRLAAEDFVFLSYSTEVARDEGVAPRPVPRVWYRGRLRQAGDGSWVFQPITDTDGFFGIELGAIDGYRTSSESPGVGILVTISHTFQLAIPQVGAAGPVVDFFETITIGQNPGAHFQS